MLNNLSINLAIAQAGSCKSKTNCKKSGCVILKVLDMKKLKEILKRQVFAHRIAEVLEVGENEITVVISHGASFSDIKTMVEEIDADFQIEREKVKINYTDQYGAKF